MQDIKYSVSKSTNLAIAHRLLNHPGKCKNIHGHDYRVVVHFTRKSETTLNEQGMVIDFGEIKDKVMCTINECDHCLVLEDGDPLICMLNEQSLNRLVLSGPPTAENMAHRFLRLANTCLEVHSIRDVYVYRVDVWETETSCATASF